MKTIKKQTEKNDNKKVKKKIEPIRTESKLPKHSSDNFADVQRLVHLLQVHQIELEHQNEELRIAHEELEASRNKYVNLFDFSPIPYFTLDKVGVIKEVNLNASKMFGTERKRLIGKNLISFVTIEHRDIFNSFIDLVFNSEKKHSCELDIKGINKDILNVKLEAIKLEDILDTDQNCQVTLIDLTEIKRIENSLKESNEELKALNANKDKYFSIIAHDLRSPFQSLLGFSELLATEIETLSQEEIVQFSRALNDDLKSVYGLLDNLLHWSRIQRNILEYNPEFIELDKVVNKITSILYQSAKSKSISISNNIDRECKVYADEDMVRLVVQNLIINAIKFTPREGHIIISAKERNDFIEVSFQDNGIGIEPGRTSELFNFNSIFTTEGTDGEKGTGLGLPLCKEFVERNFGKIWVESELGKGSKFIFTLKKSI
ncbi:MAG: PAS domain-containing sensor histidine kinase [Ignavibacteriota bacterium]